MLNVAFVFAAALVLWVNEGFVYALLLLVTTVAIGLAMNDK